VIAPARAVTHWFRHGVLCLVFSFPGCGGPAWTLHGRPLPYTKQVDTPAPTDSPAAVIPVEKIRGPVLLDCGTDDQVWTSCAYARAIQAHLSAADDRYVHVLYRYLGAGHSLNVLVPYEPGEPSPNTLGDTPLADTDADARLWPKILSFLADRTAQSGTFTASATPLPPNAR
jgi:dienelactone hydrolase